MRHCILRTLCCLLVFLSLPALAHRSSDSYLHLVVAGQSVTGQWAIALRDLEHAIGVDGNGDGEITWGELRARHGAIARYALDHLELTVSGQPCTSHETEQLVERRSDGAYAVLRFVVDCPGEIARLALSYRLFFDLDPSHRGLLRLEGQNATQVAIFSPQQPTIKLRVAKSDPWRQLYDFGRDGIRHIWSGPDHLLFLICLLLPAVLRQDAEQWKAVESFRSASWQVFKIVTAFTLAHSVTLCVFR